MKTKPSSLKKELEGVHPRVFLTQAEIDAFKDKTKSQKELWQTAISRVRAIEWLNLPPPPAEERRVQNEVGLGHCRSRFYLQNDGREKISRCRQKIYGRGSFL